MDAHTVKEILLYASITSAILPIIIGFKTRKTLLWLYPVAGLFFDLLLMLFRRVLFINHFWIANTFILVEFIIISCLYYREVFGRRKIFSIPAAALAVMFVITTTNASWQAINGHFAALFYFIYIFYGMAGLFTIIKRQEIVFLNTSGFFWMNVAFLVYASGSFILFLFWEYLLAHDEKLFLNLWSKVFVSLNITKNVLIALSLYYYKKENARFR